MTTDLILTVKSLYARDFNSKETMQWLTANRMGWWSWGCSSRTNFEEKALVLKVSGRYHAGYVVITLNWNDTYQVNIVNNRGRILDTYKEVHVDDLFNAIDDRIETVGK